MENIKSSSLKSKKEVINDLKELNQLVNDSKEGYQSAAEATDNADMKAIFSKLSGERIVYAAELTEHIALHDEDSNDSNEGILGGIQEVWQNFKEILNNKDEKDLLKAISISERAAIQKYDECIANYADHSDHLNLLAEQRDGLKVALAEIETLIVRQNN